MVQRPRVTTEELRAETEADRLERLARIAGARPWPGAPEEQEVEPLTATAAELVERHSAPDPEDVEAGWKALALIAAGRAQGPTTRAARQAEIERRKTLEERARQRWQELLAARNEPRPGYIWTEPRQSREPVALQPGDVVELDPFDCMRPFGVREVRVLEILPAEPKAGRRRSDLLLLEVPGWRLRLERAPENVAFLSRQEPRSRGGDTSLPCPDARRNLDALEGPGSPGVDQSGGDLP